MKTVYLFDCHRPTDPPTTYSYTHTPNEHIPTDPPTDCHILLLVLHSVIFENFHNHLIPVIKNK